MAYTINKTNGAVLATVADGTSDNTTDLTLIGKNYSGYGEIYNENLVKLLENFASSSQPASPLAGQLWWDLSNSVLKVFTGTAFKNIAGSTASASQPTTPITGDLWFDTVNQQLKAYNGSTWSLIGPSYSSTTGVSGTETLTVTDSVSSNHVIVKFLVGGTTVAILSKDSTFTPVPGISGFTTISAGIQLSNSLASNPTFVGTVANADLLDNLNSTQFVRADANASMSGTLSLTNDNGLTVGAASTLKVNITGTDAYVTNQLSNGDIIFKVNVGGTSTTALTIDGATGALLATTPAANTNSTRVATTAYVDSTSNGFLKVDGSKSLTGSLIPSTNQTLDLGSPANRFADIYSVNFNGTAISALYADLAERFEADATYTPGTVVQLGGVKEITAAVDELSDSVFGVISTRAGFLMNKGAGSDETHPPIAMTGRVPVRVIGLVNKGDRLVSAGNGVARAAKANEATSFNVIGRSLENKTTTVEGTVLAVVKVQ